MTGIGTGASALALGLALWSAPASAQTSDDSAIPAPATAPAVPPDAATAQTPRTVDAPAVAAAQPAAAIDATATAAGGRTSYPAAYFTQYGPSTALQIVQRVPGFTIQETDQNVRGFAGAAGNIVINGQRPSSKTDSLETLLARIPANRVLRVEVGSGDLFGAEYSGKAQVLNLVMNAAGGVAGTITAGLQRDFTGNLMPQRQRLGADPHRQIDLQRRRHRQPVPHRRRRHRHRHRPARRQPAGIPRKGESLRPTQRRGDRGVGL